VNEPRGGEVIQPPMKQELTASLPAPGLVDTRVLSARERAPPSA